MENNFPTEPRRRALCNERSHLRRDNVCTARCYDRRMPAKVPWLPSVIPPGARPERCPSCGRMALIPWTLRRDNDTKVIFRTWVCTECQTLVERPEPE